MNDGRHSDGEQEQAPVPGLASLRTPRAPGRDLWPGIESRLRPRRSRAPLIGMLSLAASLLLAVGLTLERGGWEPVRAPLHAPAQVAAARPPADAALLPAVAHMHPETRALVKANLKIVDSAETQIRRALNADPDAEYLKSLLASTRQQKQGLHVVLADAR